MGEADHRLAAVGGRTGGSCRRRIRRACPAKRPYSGGSCGGAAGCHCGCLVRGRRSRAAGEDRGAARLDRPTAVRQGRVFCINDELLNTPATSLLGGLRAMAWALHPELFPQPCRNTSAISGCDMNGERWRRTTSSWPKNSLRWPTRAGSVEDLMSVIVGPPAGAAAPLRLGRLLHD